MRRVARGSVIAHLRGRRRIAGLALITAAAFAVVAISGQVDLADSQAPALARASLTIVADAPLTPVPRSWLGISTEYWALPLYAQRMALFERVLALVHAPGTGPMVLRIGGDSADHAFWSPRVRHLPGWAFTIGPQWLRATRGLVRRLGLRVILDLNLVTDSPPSAARWARAAEAGLPRGSIVGFEVGNEPDIYDHRLWTSMTAAGAVGHRALPSAITAADYVADFHAYAAALKQVAPAVPLLGPAVANPRAHADWVASLLAGARAQLSAVSAHRYPYSACVPKRSPVYPTITRLLSRRATTGMADGLATVVSLAHRAGLPLRLTELNSVTCGGRPGVSDTFASALWAPDALLGLLRAGVDAVNLHIRANTINAPFALNRGGLMARPLLYGLILFARMLGPQAALERVQLHAKPSLRLRAWAMQVGGGTLHVLLINQGGRSVRVGLRLPTTGPASIQRLLGPSTRARLGVTLDGQRLGRDGAWRRRAAPQTVKASARGYRVTVPGFSAALLTARLAPERSSAPARR